jgi:hypothetical protein
MDRAGDDAVTGSRFSAHQNATAGMGRSLDLFDEFSEWTIAAD